MIITRRVTLYKEVSRFSLLPPFKRTTTEPIGEYYTSSQWFDILRELAVSGYKQAELKDVDDYGNLEVIVRR